MRIHKTKAILGLIIVFLLIAAPVLAKNNQTVVIGGSIGSYHFYEEGLNEIDSLIYGSEFLEWYLFDDIGIGIRSHKFYQTGSSESNEEFLMVNINLAVTWVFLGSSDDFRMAVYGGYGPGEVSTNSVVQTNGEGQTDVTAKANTTSAGIFLDWGGDTWGVRVGYHLVSAHFDYQGGPDSGTIDGSGNSFDLGIRLAF
ncbi:MAG: hypothetical protein HQ517_01855 [SAR324 cluster bacterium]|nr:hypothetical protein [SAR324 cluster bacterium]